MVGHSAAQKAGSLEHHWVAQKADRKVENLVENSAESLVRLKVVNWVDR